MKTRLAEVISALKQERAHLERVIAALESLNGNRPKVIGRGILSPAARQRIAAAQKKRWAKWRKQNA